MRRRARVALLLWPVLLITGSGWVWSVNSAGRPISVPSARTGTASTAGAGTASTARVRADCGTRRHPCCQPSTRSSRPVAPSRCLTISAAPDPSTYPQPVVITGQLLGPGQGHLLGEEDTGPQLLVTGKFRRLQGLGAPYQALPLLGQFLMT